MKAKCNQLLVLLISTTLMFATVPGFAFAETDGAGNNANEIVKWTFADWEAPYEGTVPVYGTINANVDTNVVILKGAADPTLDNPYSGPYVKGTPQSADNGVIQREVNILVGPRTLKDSDPNKGDVTVSASINKRTGNRSEYLSEMMADFRRDSEGNVLYSPHNERGIYTIKEDAVYTIHWDFWTEEQGEGFVVNGQQKLQKNGETLAQSKVAELENYSDGENLPDEIVSDYIWFKNIDVADGIRVFTNVPEEKGMQEAHSYVSKDWVTGKGYGSVEKIESDGSVYLLKGGSTANEPAYATGPYSKKGNQTFENGNLVKELNIMINPDDEDCYVDNGVKFALSCALNDPSGNAAAEMIYVLQKDGNAVKITGTDIELDKKDVYTFRIENTRDIFGKVYVQLKVLHRGTLVGQSDLTRMDEDRTYSNQNNAVEHRYIWFSSINVKDGIKLYKDVPPCPADSITVNKTYVELEAGDGVQLNAVITPDYTTDKTVTWSSSNEKVAVVKDGKVTAVKKGSAIITATTSNGKEAKCAVTVNTKDLPAPDKVNVKLYGYDDIQVRWSKVTGADGYYVFYKKSTSTTWRTPKQTTGTSIKIADLANGTKYSFMVCPYTKAANGEIYVSDSFALSSDIDTLKRISTPVVKKYSSGKVNVSWSNIPGESGYQISKSTEKNKTNIVTTYNTRLFNFFRG